MHNENEELRIHEQITLSAYQIYLAHGFHPGNDVADWLAAEKELNELSESEGGEQATGSLAKVRNSLNHLQTSIESLPRRHPWALVHQVCWGG
jgi:hypothetical protein